jgi:hypothetical protein
MTLKCNKCGEMFGTTATDKRLLRALNTKFRREHNHKGGGKK